MDQSSKITDCPAKARADRLVVETLKMIKDEVVFAQTSIVFLSPLGGVVWTKEDEQRFDTVLAECFKKGTPD